LLPLFAGFAPTVSRELPFALVKFLTFDLLAKTIISFINGQSMEGALPVQIGVGPIGLTVSAVAGALAGIVGAIISHPADLILTYTSASSQNEQQQPTNNISMEDDTTYATTKDITKEEQQVGSFTVEEESSNDDAQWLTIVKDLISQEGGIANLFVGLPARATFFFLVIGLQFFLYDYVKGLLQVGADDLDLILDVFYAVRAGLQ